MLEGENANNKKNMEKHTSKLNYKLTSTRTNF